MCNKSSSTLNNWPCDPCTLSISDPDDTISTEPDRKELSFTSNLLNESVFPIISPLALILPDAVIFVKGWSMLDAKT